MARIQWHGHNFNAKPLEQYDNGDWLMEAQAHGARFSPGSKIRVKASEILEMADGEVPSHTESLSALESALAAEREIIPPVTELLAQAAADRQQKDTANGQAPQA